MTILIGDRRRARLARAIDGITQARRQGVLALGAEAGVNPREAVQAWEAKEVSAEAHCRLTFCLGLSPVTLKAASEAVRDPAFAIDWWRLGCFASIATKGGVATVTSVIAAFRGGAPLPDAEALAAQMAPQRAIAKASGANLQAVNSVLRGNAVGIDNMVRLLALAGIDAWQVRYAEREGHARPVVRQQAPRSTGNRRSNTLKSHDAPAETEAVS